MSNAETPRVDELGDEWVTIADAAGLIGKSVKTVRRALKAGDMEGMLAFDGKIGSRADFEKERRQRAEEERDASTAAADELKARVAELEALRWYQRRRTAL